MIGTLPTTVILNEIEYEIRSDYREIINILVAFNDADLTDKEKWFVALKCFYVDFDNLPSDYYEEAIKQFNWFLYCGREEPKAITQKPVYDWEQDEQMIFSAINKVANKEIRSLDYLHWWTFFGYFNEIGEGMFSTVVNIRNKKANGKKLEKYEKEFYNNNLDIVKLKKKLSEADKEFLNEVNSILEGGS